MKKIIIALVFILSLFGCSENDKTPVNTSSVVLDNAETKEEKKITKSNLDYLDKMNKYEGCIYDFNSNGAEEQILLLTDAKKDETGEYMWDDSHHWQLIVNADDGDYILYDEYVHGNLELSLSEYYNSDGSTHPVIRLMISTGASFVIKEYTYENNVFFEKTVYDTGYINELSVEKY